MNMNERYTEYANDDEEQHNILANIGQRNKHLIFKVDIKSRKRTKLIAK